MVPGKLGRSWVGAWVVHGIVLVYGGGGGVLPGLVRLDLSIGGGLDGDDEEVIGGVSGCKMNFYSSVLFGYQYLTVLKYLEGASIVN